MTKKNIRISICQGIIAIPALWLIVFYSSWQTALGIFLLLWANNLDYKKEDH